MRVSSQFWCVSSSVMGVEYRFIFYLFISYVCIYKPNQMDADMSEVPPPRYNAKKIQGIPNVVVKAAPKPISLTENEMNAPITETETSLKELLKKSEMETLRDEIALMIQKVENSTMSRIDVIEKLMKEHAHREEVAARNVEALRQAIESNHSMVDTLTQIMKDTEVSLAKALSGNTHSKAEEETADIAATPIPAASNGGGDVEDDGANAQQSGGGLKQRPSVMPSHDQEMNRISPEESALIAAEINLRHVWIYMSCGDDEKAYKVRVRSITVADIAHIYERGGSVYPVVKTCENWASFVEFRQKFSAKKHYTHCREKVVSF